jgi:hypothetical protein
MYLYVNNAFFTGDLSNLAWEGSCVCRENTILCCFFRWVFNQADELRSTSAAFEGKIYNISIVGIDGGSAMNCTPCAAGSYSDNDNTDCSICKIGTFSTLGSSRCKNCKNGTFADGVSISKYLAFTKYDQLCCTTLCSL